MKTAKTAATKPASKAKKQSLEIEFELGCRWKFVASSVLSDARGNLYLRKSGESPEKATVLEVTEWAAKVIPFAESWSGELSFILDRAADRIRQLEKSA